jgi:hypothetical protein
MTNEASEREAFEAWYSEGDPSKRSVERDSCGGYILMGAAMAWKAWQARAAAPAVHAPHKLWLWKNFVDGKPEYWAFDNPYPTRMDCGDPQTLGQPCGYALFKPSRDGSHGRTEEQVLREMASVASLYAAAPTAAQPNTDGVAIPQSKQEN